MEQTKQMIEKLYTEHTLNKEEYIKLLSMFKNPKIGEIIREKALELRYKYYGNKVFTRGLIEISNYCKNNCFYCGIRNGNQNCNRYRLSEDEILECCLEGYQLGFRTFVLQGGEDAYFTDERLTECVQKIKSRFPECAITLSVGERARESYERLKKAGADRYLLRHETANRGLYNSIHPKEMSFENRRKCLVELKELGYQVGAGMMIGIPGQTIEMLAEDLLFLQELQPHMVGMGPFIPHHDTIYAEKQAGSVELTLYLISIVRLILPKALIPATTALGTLEPKGREKGLLAGANVVMPNLSPINYRKSYELYDNKICTGEESAQCVECITDRVKSIGFEIVTERGDPAEL